jgi:hypothetical protein
VMVELLDAKRSCAVVAAFALSFGVREKPGERSLTKSSERGLTKPGERDLTKSGERGRSDEIK